MPVKVHLLQLAVWALPSVVGFAVALLFGQETVWMRLVVAGFGAAFIVTAVDVSRFVVARTGDDSGIAAHTAWFTDYDEVDFSSLFSAATFRALWPPRRTWVHGVAAPILSFLLVGAAAAVSDVESIEKDLGPNAGPAAATLLAAKCMFAVATAQFGLMAGPPVEATSHRLYDPLSFLGLLADHSRPLFLIILMAPMLLTTGTCNTCTCQDCSSSAGVAGAWLRLAVGAAPTLWAVGLLPQLATACAWALDQGEVHLFGGSPMIRVLRLLGSVGASLAVATMLAVVAEMGAGLSLEAASIVVIAIGLPLAVFLVLLPPSIGDMSQKRLRRSFVHAIRTLLQVAFDIGIGLGLLLGFGVEAVSGSLTARRDGKAVAAWISRLALEQVAALLWLPGVSLSSFARRWKIAADSARQSGGLPAVERGLLGEIFRIHSPYQKLDLFARVVTLAHAACFGVVALHGLGAIRGGAMATDLFLLGFEAAMLLRAWRVALTDTLRATFDAWLVGVLDVVLYTFRSSDDPGPRHFARWSLGLRLLAVSVGRLPKLWHPLTGRLLFANVVLFPFLLFVLCVSAALETPLLALFTLPCFAVGYLRPRHGHPELCLESVVSTKGMEGVFYKILEPSLLNGLVPLWRNNLISKEPGSMLFCRCHERLSCLVRVLGFGLGWVEVELRGLELQEPTSCHHVEAGRVDDTFAASFQDATYTTASRVVARSDRGGTGAWRQSDAAQEVAVESPPSLFALRPLGQVRVEGYEQTLLSMTGILDSPESLRQVHCLFLKTLVWVMAQQFESGGVGSVPARWVSCPVKARDFEMLSKKIRSSSWLKHVADLFCCGNLQVEAGADFEYHAVYPSSPAGEYPPSIGTRDGGCSIVAGSHVRGRGSKQSARQPSPSWQRLGSEVDDDTDLPLTSPSQRTSSKNRSRSYDSSGRPQSRGSALSLTQLSSGGGGRWQTPSPLLLRSGGAADRKSPNTEEDDSTDLDALMEMVMDISPRKVAVGNQARRPLPLVFETTKDDKGFATAHVNGSGSPRSVAKGAASTLLLSRNSSSPQLAEARGNHGRSSPSTVVFPTQSGCSSAPATPKVDRTEFSRKGFEVVAHLAIQSYVAVNVAPLYGQNPESLGVGHLLKAFTGSFGQGCEQGEVTWLKERPEVFDLTVRAFRYALKVAVDCVATGEDSSTMKDEELEEALKELDSSWHLGDDGSPQWQAAMEQRRRSLMSFRRKPGTAEYQVMRLSLVDDEARVGLLRPEVVQCIWASASLELRYLANDDDERYSIQAHPTLLRNLIVQSAEYPIYVSSPTTIWL
eukprot:TRINITY_DN32985_c0_g1_i1.p1 TRINITY_DN32985_c0_g1~~TRINITY_DN32985_c0_g1_i1.p1  ORF type:complete len:1382 (+),score=223.12 TRINITY_DN32985_c0_g1_i1:245-4147(+)